MNWNKRLMSIGLISVCAVGFLFVQGALDQSKTRAETKNTVDMFLEDFKIVLPEEFLEVELLEASMEDEEPEDALGNNQEIIVVPQITEDEALLLVKQYEVAHGNNYIWYDEVKKEYGIFSGYALESHGIRVEGEKTYYLFQLYTVQYGNTDDEEPIGFTSTYNWYEVDVLTGEVTTVF